MGRVVLAGDAAHVTNPTGGLGLTCGLFDSYALYPALAAIIVERADDAVLDRYSAARRDIFLNRVSPQAIANKQLIYHDNGGGAKLAAALASCVAYVGFAVLKTTDARANAAALLYADEVLADP